MGIYDSNYDLNKYRIFYAVAECNSFSKASDILHISQPAVSYAIKELERELDTKLFVRNSKTIKLTDVGEKLLFYVKNAFTNIVKAESLVKEIDEKGTIKVGIYSHLSLFTMPKLIKEFQKKYPNVKFSIYSSSTYEMRDMLVNKELDIVIAQYPTFLNDSNFKEEILCEMENCFFASTKYHDIIELNNRNYSYPLILPFDGYIDINLLEEKFKRINLNVTDNIRCYTNELVKKFVLEGMGIGWGLKKVIEKEIEDKTFFEVPVEFDIPKTIFSIAYNEKEANDITRNFINYIKNNINDVIK